MAQEFPLQQLDSDGHVNNVWSVRVPLKPVLPLAYE